MAKLIDTLAGIRVLEERESKINGKLTVVKDLAWGVHIKAGGLTQSGGVVIGVWKTTLRKISQLHHTPIKKVLILGLGGGTIAQVISKKWPEASIVGVDLDRDFVELGKKYLQLDELNVEAIIEDGIAYCKKAIKAGNKFDLIFVDMYQGDLLPEEFDSQEFIEMTKSLLIDDGLVIFNRLFYGEKRLAAYRFLRKLEKIYPIVDPLYPEANVMFICGKK